MITRFWKWLCESRRKNWLWISHDTLSTIAKESAFAKVDAWRKTRALERIAAVTESSTCPHCKAVDKLALNALGVHERPIPEYEWKP